MLSVTDSLSQLISDWTVTSFDPSSDRGLIIICAMIDGNLFRDGSVACRHL